MDMNDGCIEEKHVNHQSMCNNIEEMFGFLFKILSSILLKSSNCHVIQSKKPKSRQALCEAQSRAIEQRRRL